MLGVSGGDELNVDVYYVKEHSESEVVGEDGQVRKVRKVDAKLVINPPDSYLRRKDVEVVSRRPVKVQIMEINKVGGRLVKPRYLVGMRFIDNGRPTSTFHILVGSDEEFREKVKKEVEYYIRVVNLIKP